MNKFLFLNYLDRLGFALEALNLKFDRNEFCLSDEDVQEVAEEWCIDAYEIPQMVDSLFDNWDAYYDRINALLGE